MGRLKNYFSQTLFWIFQTPCLFTDILVKANLFSLVGQCVSLYLSTVYIAVNYEQYRLLLLNQPLVSLKRICLNLLSLLA